MDLVEVDMEEVEFLGILWAEELVDILVDMVE